MVSKEFFLEDPVDERPPLLYDVWISKLIEPNFKMAGLLFHRAAGMALSSIRPIGQMNSTQNRILGLHSEKSDRESTDHTQRAMADPNNCRSTSRRIQWPAIAKGGNQCFAHTLAAMAAASKLFSAPNGATARKLFRTNQSTSHWSKMALGDRKTLASRLVQRNSPAKLVKIWRSCIWGWRQPLSTAQWKLAKSARDGYTLLVHVMRVDVFCTGVYTLGRKSRKPCPKWPKRSYVSDRVLRLGDNIFADFL